MTSIDGHGNIHHPAGTTAGGQFAAHARTRPTDTLEAPVVVAEPVPTRADAIRVGDVVVGDAWNDETDSEVIVQRRVFDVRGYTRLSDMRSMIDIIYDDGTTSYPVPANARLRVIAAPLPANARDPKELLDDMRELTRLVRTGQASDQVVADAIRAAEDPGRDRNTDAYAKHLASYLELDGLFPDAVARLRAASDGA
ncbi:hypothetical protein [Microbacterium xylanilyticum]